MSKDNTPNGQAKAAEAMPSIDCEQLAGFLFPSAGTTWIERTLFEFINSPHFASVARDLGYWKIKKDGETVQDTVMLPVIPLRDYEALEASLKAKDEEIAGLKAARSYKNVLKRDNNALREQLAAAKEQLSLEMKASDDFEEGLIKSQLENDALKAQLKAVTSQLEFAQEKLGRANKWAKAHGCMVWLNDAPDMPMAQVTSYSHQSKGEGV